MGTESCESARFFLFDELEDLVVSMIVDIMRGVMEGSMAQHKSATFVLSITNAQWDGLCATLSSTCRGIIGKLLHGIAMHHDHILVGGIPTHPL